MEILILLIFVSVILVGAAVAFFVWTVRQGTFDHADRLALLPLDDESPVTPTVERETERDEDEYADSTDRL
ncbi:MAG: cbb3-type cytochrome oxidase assembly protein CcoS [Deltaproteobacteria bacterium]|nr:cbb3-type cytochrome oxidase assembly protein CcoS [Deltaproteobacteria bacterium]MBW2211971.1 cbb3-type cytochrome oxidase assembly protein CcoS [Deltaproteobacteria bacterium]MBW2381134.1 cbb3-type cytochrome oxidase assembly protein CcoS [Deltaproteobacteria bacterium]MBW2552353.1 cbb3-type cytochrome oxidase assembly protein CcoS [Deltaproteobacteria bacterium]MBW2628914.1 cbb3-type cytochrome oxidase assembly protein CcoS [Deltaproteobacteria bacterium]